MTSITKFSISTLTAFTLLYALAFSSVGLSADYCTSSLSQGNLNFAHFQTLAQDTHSQLSFSNSGGLMNGGVCWWHSRFTRNALYLATYHPERNKLSHDDAVKAIHNLMDGKHVVEVNGYSDLHDFAQDYAQEIEHTLEQAQMGTALGFGWLHGIEGGHIVNANKLSKEMDDLYHEVTVEKKVVYQMLKMSGPVAHAWLVVGMEKLANGYQINVIDSNFAGQITSYSYVRGNQDISYGYGMSDFAPYTQEEQKFGDYQKAITRYCGK